MNIYNILGFTSGLLDYKYPGLGTLTTFLSSIIFEENYHAVRSSHTVTSTTFTASAFKECLFSHNNPYKCLIANIATVTLSHISTDISHHFKEDIEDYFKAIPEYLTHTYKKAIDYFSYNDEEPINNIDNLETPHDEL